VANVFISYARRDKARVVQLTNVLESEGLSVWWDSDLVPGRRYRQTIAEQLSIADSVIVVWSAAALESDWVQDEAEEGRQRGVLIPVLPEPVRAPAGFRQVQGADLSQWTGTPEHPEFRSLVFAVRSLVQVARASDKNAAPPPPAPVAALPAAETQSVVHVPEQVPASFAEPKATVEPPTTDPVATVRAATPTSDVAPPASPAHALTDAMFGWSTWLRTAAAMAAFASVALLSSHYIRDRAALGFLLCGVPILAGAAAAACRRVQVSVPIFSSDIFFD
jgi:TIR domain